MEGAHFLKTGDLLKLSEQQFVDCDTKSKGCDGGLESYAYQYAKKNPIELEKDYQYKGENNDCKAQESKEIVQATTYHNVRKWSNAQLKASIAL